MCWTCEYLFIPSAIINYSGQENGDSANTYVTIIVVLRMSTITSFVNKQDGHTRDVIRSQLYPPIERTYDQHRW